MLVNINKHDLSNNLYIDNFVFNVSSTNYWTINEYTKSHKLDHTDSHTFFHRLPIGVTKRFFIANRHPHSKAGTKEKSIINGRRDHN